MVGAGDLVVGDDVRGRGPVGELAGGLVSILLAKYGLNIRNGKAVAVEQRRIHFHTHGRTGASPDRHLSNTRDLRKLLRNDRRRLVIERRLVVLIRCEAQNQNRRIRGIHFAIRRVGGQVCRQVSTRRVDRRLHVSRGAVDIAAQIELESDRGAAKRAR